MRCKELCVGNEKVCGGHLRKKNNPSANMNKNRSGSYWGLVCDPISDFGDGKNYIAFGPWFMEKAKQYPLSEESMRKLKTLHSAATEGLADAAPILPMPPKANVAEVAPKKKGPGRKKKESSDPSTSTVSVAAPVVTAVPAPAVAPAAAPSEPKKKRAPKKALTETPVVVPASGIVIDATPLEIEDFVEIPVRSFEINGRLYYLDPKKSKLYDRTKGTYQGRWDSVTESIVTSIPDSDSE